MSRELETGCCCRGNLTSLVLEVCEYRERVFSIYLLVAVCSQMDEGNGIKKGRKVRFREASPQQEQEVNGRDGRRNRKI